jgi:TIGR03009 family protein
MRALFVLPALLLASTLVAAQQGAAPAQDPNAQLDLVLMGWEKTLTSLRSLHVECQRTTVDKVFRTTEVFKGSAKYLKTPGPGQGSRASLELYKLTAQGPSTTVFEKYICTGTFLYEYSPANKVIRVHDLPQPKAGQISDDNFLSFLFGMKAVEAKQRYQLSLTLPSVPDKYYHYIQIQPKLAQDKADFTTAQLVLMRDSFLPRRVWFHQPNGNEITWDFPQVRRDVDIPPAAFEQPRLPQGWKFDRVTGDARPKVRGNGP